MNLTKTREVLTALRDDEYIAEVFQEDTESRKQWREHNRAALDFIIDMLDTEKWPEHAKIVYAESCNAEREYDSAEAEDRSDRLIHFDVMVALSAGAVALALVPQLEARVKVLTEALEEISDKLDCAEPCGVESECCGECGHLKNVWCAGCAARRALTGAKENEHE